MEARRTQCSDYHKNVNMALNAIKLKPKITIIYVDPMLMGQWDK